MSQNKKKRIRFLLPIGLILTVLFVFFIFGKKVKQRWIVEKTIKSDHWQERVTEIEKAASRPYKTVFLGNSLTEMFDLYAWFQDSSILNCGISGDFSEGLLERRGVIVKLKPEKIFIEIGINDMIEKIPLEEICANYEKLIEYIQAECPQTRIYIQSNLPVIINRPSLLTGDNDVNNLVLKQNKNLEALAAKYHCGYVDIYSGMAKEKDKNSLFIPDGIHLSSKGYAIWAEAVKGL